jgi:gluconolactonase
LLQHRGAAATMISEGRSRGAKRSLALLAVFLAAVLSSAIGAEPRLVKGLASPESVLVGPRGDVYVSQIGEFGKDGDGSIAKVEPDGTITVFAAGLDDPKGLAHDGVHLYVTDRDRIWRIDQSGVATVFVNRAAFPLVPKFLNDIVHDGAGNLYVSDSGDISKGGGGAIYRITPRGKVDLLVSSRDDPLVQSPNGLAMDGPTRLLVVDFATGDLYRISLKTGKSERLATGFGGGDGLALDKAKHLYVSDWKNGQVWRLTLNDRVLRPLMYEQKFQAAADIALDASERYLLVPDMKAGTLTWLPVDLLPGLGRETRTP